ncbi:hypothetical protein TNCV_4140751 [Trichonephila clavipes]|nr:hypothetical protein TNCV_4140751 [Trichonephila clavipes]
MKQRELRLFVTILLTLSLIRVMGMMPQLATYFPNFYITVHVLRLDRFKVHQPLFTSNLLWHQDSREPTWFKNNGDNLEIVTNHRTMAIEKGHMFVTLSWFSQNFKTYCQ